MIPKWQPKKTMIINLICIAIGAFLLFFIGRDASLASLSYFLIGIGFAGGMVATVVLMGDAIDNDELITGKRREAVYGGVNAIVTKPAISLANSLFLFTIGIFGFVPPIIIGDVSINQPQNELAKTGILVILGIIPACLLLLSALTMRLYPLDGPEWIEKKKFIIDLHEQKEKEYLQSLDTKKGT